MALVYISILYIDLQLGNPPLPSSLPPSTLSPPLDLSQQSAFVPGLSESQQPRESSTDSNMDSGPEIYSLSEYTVIYMSVYVNSNDGERIRIDFSFELIAEYEKIILLISQCYSTLGTWPHVGVAWISYGGNLKCFVIDSKKISDKNIFN